VAKSQVFERQGVMKDYTIKEDDNLDWKFISITPPPKKEPKATDLIKIEMLPKYCRQAFGYTKSLN